MFRRRLVETCIGAILSTVAEFLPRVWAIEWAQTPHCNEIVMMNGSERVKLSPQLTKRSHL
jgi:hypothetical protein